MQTNYTIKGTGKAIILIHGWAKNASIKSLSALQNELAKLRFKVYNLELPGFGVSPAPPSYWGVKDYAEFVEDFIKEYVKEKEFILFGHSFGGSLVGFIASNDEISVEKIILCSSSGLRYKTLKAKTLLPFSKIFKFILSVLPTNLESKLRKFIYYYIIRERDYVDSSKTQEQFRRVTNEDLEENFKRIQIPTLIIWGKDDKVTPLAMGQKLHKLILNSKLEIIEGSHGIPLTNPKKIAQLIKEFVD